MKDFAEVPSEAACESFRASDVTVKDADGNVLRTEPAYDRHELYTIVAKGQKRARRRASRKAAKNGR